MGFLHRTWAEINISALIHNFKLIKKQSGSAKITAVVKADAYGHGVGIIAPVLDKCGADAFAVSNIDEALELRELGIAKDILILGYTPPIMAKTLADNNISQAVYCLQFAKELSDNAQKSGVNVKIHLKLDSGMARLGFDCRSEELKGIDEAISTLKLPRFTYEGVFTHFAAADRSGDICGEFTKKQYSLFTAACQKIESAGFKAVYSHCCNSAAFLLDKDKHFDLCRPGIILYGLTPDESIDIGTDYMPVMTLKSVVSMVKEIKQGESVSYGRTFTAKQNMRVATVAVGYADGYPRALSNKGYVLIKGKKAPIVGRICMDQMSVDVSGIYDVNIGDCVELFGNNLKVEEVARFAQTINYEIICGISKRVPRITVEN